MAPRETRYYYKNSGEHVSIFFVVSQNFSKKDESFEPCYGLWFFFCKTGKQNFGQPLLGKRVEVTNTGCDYGEEWTHAYAKNGKDYPRLAGTPTRARRPTCLVPEHWIHSLTPRFVRGFRVLQAPPLWEGLRGYRHKPLMTTGIRDGSDSIVCNSNKCASYRRSETRRFFQPFRNQLLWTFWTTLDIVQNV